MLISPKYLYRALLLAGCCVWSPGIEQYSFEAPNKLVQSSVSSPSSIAERKVLEKPADAQTSQIQKPIVTNPQKLQRVSDPEKFAFSQLEKMIFSGVREQQVLAIEQLSKHGEQAIPPLLYLIYSNTENAIKELAIGELSSRDLSITSPLLAALQLNPQFAELLVGYGSLQIEQASSVSSYLADLEMANTNNLAQIYDLLISPEIEKRQLAIEQIHLSAFDMSDGSNLLGKIIRLDESAEVRRHAFEVALEHYPSQSLQWQLLMLKDSSQINQSDALGLIDTSAEHFNLFVPALAHILFTDSPKELKRQSFNLLAESNEPAAITIVETFRSQFAEDSGGNN